MSKITWKSRWGKSDYRLKFIILILLAILLLIAMPYGFDFIQNRGGIQWNDPILNILPSLDLSWPIFISMYCLALVFIFRAVQNPDLVFRFIKSYILITILRFILIYFIPLDPPLAMVSLVDPITKIFYGGKEITRDLFFSGHTSTMFLIYLLTENKREKFFALLVVLFIAIALLFQHIHYTADVLAAFPVTYLIWKFCSKNPE
ncbi:MAG: phosphatase PAP2-related protein [Bacteroidota bacterium]